MCATRYKSICWWLTLLVMTNKFEDEAGELKKAGKYQELANEIGALVDAKNHAYGNSFAQTGEFLKFLYPDGIPVEKYDDMLCIVRIFDKLKRIATKKDAFGESPYKDIVGYALLGTQKDNEKQEIENGQPTSVLTTANMTILLKG